MLTKIKLKFHHIVFDFFSFIKKGNERSIKAKKNILAMLFLKGGNILVNLMLIPITINYVNADNYGIWLTVSSIISWMSFFDIGINNGLKRHYKIFCVNGKYGIQNRVPYFLFYTFTK